MNRKDECFQIGDASTPEEVLAKSMNQPTAPDPALRERIARLRHEAEHHDLVWEDSHRAYRRRRLAWADVLLEDYPWLAALALVPVAPRGEPEEPLPGEYDVGRIIRKAVEHDAEKGRFYLTCSVGELAQRICHVLAAPLDAGEPERKEIEIPPDIAYDFRLDLAEREPRPSPLAEEQVERLWDSFRQPGGAFFSEFHSQTQEQMTKFAAALLRAPEGLEHHNRCILRVLTGEWRCHPKCTVPPSPDRSTHTEQSAEPECCPWPGTNRCCSESAEPVASLVERLNYRADREERNSIVVESYIDGEDERQDENWRREAKAHAANARLFREAAAALLRAPEGIDHG